jgi:hypothetical protein
MQNRADPKVPGWFAAKLTEIAAGYPSMIANLGATLNVAYWRPVAIYSDAAIGRALARFGKEGTGEFMPSAEILRRLCEAENKVGDRPAANLDRKALPEPELTLPVDNPFYERLERYKRGEIPYREDARRETDAIVGGTSRGAA